MWRNWRRNGEMAARKRKKQYKIADVMLSLLSMCRKLMYFNSEHRTPISHDFFLIKSFNKMSFRSGVMPVIAKTKAWLITMHMENSSKNGFRTPDSTSDGMSFGYRAKKSSTQRKYFKNLESLGRVIGSLSS